MSERKLNLPDIPKLRYVIDFRIMPNFIFGEDGADYVELILHNQGDFMATLFNNLYKDIAEQNDFKLETTEIFTTEDFDVYSGFIAENKMITIVQLPDDPCDGIIAYRYIFVYDVDVNMEELSVNNIRNIRFFTTERNTDFNQDFALLSAMTQGKMDFDKMFELCPREFLCELLPEGRKNYGGVPAPSILGGKTIHQAVAEIVLGENQ